MCAIAGVVGNKINQIKKMTSIMRHRGPDDEKIKIYNQKKVSLSMLRLSILDLKSNATIKGSVVSKYGVNILNESVSIIKDNLPLFEGQSIGLDPFIIPESYLEY